MLQIIKAKIKKNFSSIFKPKKLVIFGFLFLIIFGLVLPQSVLAAWWEYAIPGWNVYKVGKDIVGAVAGAAGDAVANIGEQLFVALIRFAGTVLLSITGALVGLAAMLLGWVTSPGFMGVSFTGTDNIMVTNGWRVVRDLTNMFIVLGFVVIGIATILRIREYEARKILIPLIAIALLVNFSRVFCGLIIDGSNIIMDHFLTQGGQVSLGFTYTLKTQLATLWTASDDVLMNLGVVTGYVFFNLIAFIAFLLFAFL